VGPFGSRYEPMTGDEPAGSDTAELVLQRLVVPSYSGERGRHVVRWIRYKQLFHICGKSTYLEDFYIEFCSFQI
jgi:hypothetical protein